MTGAYIAMTGFTGDDTTPFLVICNYVL